MQYSNKDFFLFKVALQQNAIVMVCCYGTSFFFYPILVGYGRAGFIEVDYFIQVDNFIQVDSIYLGRFYLGRFYPGG